MATTIRIPNRLKKARALVILRKQVAKYVGGILTSTQKNDRAFRTAPIEDFRAAKRK